jgi:glycerol-1-phosphate dehydrogenase [NAD(P)+]
MPATDAVALLLAGQYPDPDSGALVAAESRAVVIEDSLAGHEDELIAALGAGPRIAVVSDRTTHAVLGARIERALARFTVQSIVLDAPRAEEDTVTRVLATLAPATDLVVAVGSGTINDLTKLIAFRHGCPQAVFATAPSMNGYTSLSASITSGGIKRSFRTRTPLGVFFDLAVLAGAPHRLIRAGLGDSACRPTAQADWLLSHLLLDTPYRRVPFALLAEDERDLFSHTAALLAGDLETMRHLVRILVLSGFGMTICNGSYPASQGEHLISHYIDMMRPRELAPTFHGEQIAVATATMAAVQERMLDRDRAPVLRPSKVTRADVLAHFGPAIGDSCWSELEHKCFDPAKLDDINGRLAASWDDIRTQIRAVTVGAEAMRRLLANAGAPYEHGQLGWSDALFESAYTHARLIRNRYTFLDLEADS